MSNPGNFNNNPLYTDITKLDHLSPQPVFNYNWNSGDSRWEPSAGVNIDNLNVDYSGTNLILSLISDQISGISGQLNSVNDQETHRLLSGVSGAIESLSLSDSSNPQSYQETHRLLSGISGQLDSVNNQETQILLSGISEKLNSINDTETHRLLSGMSGELSNLSISPDSYRLLTKTVNMKIDEDFILLENIPDQYRTGTYSGDCYGVDRFIMDDIYNVHFANGRINPSTPETGHPNYFIHAEYTDTGRCVQSDGVFHTDTAYALRFDNDKASAVNSYELKDFTELYNLGLAESVLLINESPYPIQFHTIDPTFDPEKTDDPENNNIMFLNSDTSVRIDSDEARKVFVKRPHTVSGFTMKYTITYKETGASDVILE